MDCPVVYRISKLEFDPANADADANLYTQKKPSVRVYVQGYKEPCVADGNNYLFVTDDGIWRCLQKDTMLWFLEKTNG